MPFGMPYGTSQQSVVDSSHMQPQHSQHDDLINMGNPNAQVGLGGAGAGPLPPPSYHQVLTPDQQSQHYATNGGGGNGPANSSTPTPDSQYYSSYCDTRGRSHTFLR